MASRKRRKAKALAPAAPTKATGGPVAKITPEILALSRVKPKAKGKKRKPADVFRVAEHPPAALPADDRRMAQDESIEASLAWAAQAYAGDDGVETVGFLGYPYLVALAQRPEYRRISETIATEMTRRWIKLTAVGESDKSEKIEALNAALKRYGVRDLFRRCAEQDGFYGRAHLYVDLGDLDRTELATPIGNGRDAASKNKIAKGSLRGFRTVEAVWAYPQDYDTSDPLSPSWYRPARWFVQGKDVHGTRLLTFIGREVADLLKPAYSFGGLAMSQIAKPYVDNWLRTRQSVADLVSSFSVSGIKIGLASALANGAGDELFNRVDLFNNLRDNRNTMVLDKGAGGEDPGEEFFNVSTPLSGLDKLQAQSQEHMASVSGVPLVKLLGITPSGLNASTDGEVRVFYDSIHAYQGKLFTENLEAVLGIIQLSEFGEIDPDIGFEYEPLWSLDEEAAAAVRKTEAETDAVLVGANVISVTEARHRIAGDETTPYMSLQPDAAPPLPEEKRVTLGVAKAGVIIQAAADGLYPEHAALEGLRDTGLFPGISAVDIALAKAEPPAPDNDPELPGPGEPGAADDARDPVAEALAADAAPAPLYVHRKVLNAADVIAWAVSQGLPVTVPAEEMHVTVARSRSAIDWMRVGAAYDGPTFEVPAGGPRLVEQFGEAVVLSFASEMLAWRWQAFRDAGASWDHEGYQPHVTLAYGAGPIDLAGVEPYAGPLVLGPEIFAPLNEPPLAEAA